MPDVNDLPEITGLMVECFDRTLAKKRWDADKMGPFGGLAQYVNAFIDQNEVNGIADGVQMRLDSTLQLQSLRRPIKQDQTVALVARIKQGGPLIAYVEICILPDDGRRPETDNGKMEPGTTRQPYLSNLCVGLPYRRSGIGRAMLALAEDVVRHIWKDPKMYLHIDNYGPARKLYESEGFVATGPADADDVTHMMKDLGVEVEELIDDDEEDELADIESDDEEAETEAKALPEASENLDEDEEKDEEEEKEEKEEKVAWASFLLEHLLKQCKLWLSIFVMKNVLSIEYKMLQTSKDALRRLLWLSGAELFLVDSFWKQSFRPIRSLLKIWPSHAWS